jgi:hypothetical protein
VAQVVHPAEGEFDLSGYKDVVEAVIAVITRHPMNETDLIHTLERWSLGQVQESLQALQSSGRAQVVERYGVRFWSAAPARYPDQPHSQSAVPE